MVSLSDTLKHLIASFTSHSANTDFSFLSSQKFVPLAYFLYILVFHPDDLCSDFVDIARHIFEFVI